MKKKIMILIIFILIAFLSVGYATLQTNLGITGNVSIKGSNVVTFNANGGSVSTSTKKVVLNSTYGTLPTPTRSEYEFSGWYTSASGGTKVTDTTKVTNGSNHTLYAHWIRSTIHINHTGWNGFVIEEGKIINPEYGDTLNIAIEEGKYTLNTVCKIGAGLGHIYFTSTSGTNTDICNKNSYDDSNPVIAEVNIVDSGVLTIYGAADLEMSITESKKKVEFVLDGYRITYDFNGGRTNAPPYGYNDIVQKGDSISIPYRGNYCLKPGNEWVGFALNKNATEKDIIKSLTPTGDTILYAIYKPGLKYHTEGFTLFKANSTSNEGFTLLNSEHASEYTIIDIPEANYYFYYTLKAGAIGSNISFQDLNGNEVLKIQYEGKTLQGGKNISGPGKLILYGSGSVHITNKDSSNDVGVYWDDNYGKITYDANGGGFFYNAMVEYGFKKNSNVTLYTEYNNGGEVYRTGYTLLGFSTNQNATTVTYTPGQIVKFNDSITLYAVWQKN